MAFYCISLAKIAAPSLAWASKCSDENRKFVSFLSLQPFSAFLCAQALLSTAQHRGAGAVKSSSKLPFRLLLWPLFSEMTSKRTIKVLPIIFTMIVAGLFPPSPIAKAPGAEVCSCTLVSSSCTHTKLVYFCRVALRCFAAVSDTWIFLAIYIIRLKKKNKFLNTYRNSKSFVSLQRKRWEIWG